MAQIIPEKYKFKEINAIEVAYNPIVVKSAVWKTMIPFLVLNP